MTTDQLRQRFLRFFASKNHKIYPSDSLIPKDDPTLLFTSAGMNQFKQEFLGKSTEFRRRATCQRCLRTDDLDKVGKTNFHHTFFEMLGNFSFGDYFKEEAIDLAWEFVTKELNLPTDRLWVSVYQEDKEAYKIWRKTGVAQEKIVKFGAKENFWPSNAPEDGPNGPCGPCSEIFYDQGPEVGCGRPDCSPACKCERFVEAWNLVFTQFERKGKNNLLPLPNKNIDTGMGLERMAAVLQGKPNNFEIDIFKDIVEAIANLAARSPNIRTCYTIADHIRAVTFAISDGALPSNDERGYVIRKLIRRAVWHGHALGIKKVFLYKIVPIVCRVMKSAYPELGGKREEIAQVVLAEEKRFHKTLERAMKFAEDIIADINKQFGKGQLSGEDAFRLYDTYGLPLEMLENIATSRGVKLDKEGFERELEFQRRSSRQGAAFEAGVFVGSLVSKYKLKPTKFIGDKCYVAKTKVLNLFKDEQSQEQAREGEELKIVLETTPFYGESGGQIGDTGVIRNKKVKVDIIDTHKIDQTIIHLGKVIKGVIKVNDSVEATIDLQRRKDIVQNHSATHLLQAALRKVLGEHVRQSGSWVGAEKLRFDFSHFQALTKREINRVEELVNHQIKVKRKLNVLRMNYEESQKLGALAFFGEKYQEKVRVVKIGDMSLELCGGTHVSSTGEIGMFKIIGESSVASGIRRIEAVTGRKAFEVLRKAKSERQELVEAFAGSPQALPERIEELLSKIKELNRRLDKSRLDNFKSRIDEILEQAPELSGTKVIIRRIESVDIRLLRLMSDLLRQRVRSSIVVLGSVWEERVLIVCAITKELCSQGLDAAKIIRTIARDVQGSGGGRADFAQAGGRNPEGLDGALAKAEEIVKKELKQ